MRKALQMVTALSAPVLLAACGQDDDISTDAEPYDGISESEKLTLLGNEPFWNIAIDGETATYSSPENIDGTEFTVARFAGNNGLGFSGELDGASMQITVTPGMCSDGMSDRDYPFTVTISWGDRSLEGCAYTDQEPFTGEEAP